MHTVELVDFFLQCLPLIDQIITAIAQRHRLSDSDADEFRAFAHERLIDNDYAILRKFEERSSIKTFLTVVLSNLFKDFRNAVWGRWRPSSAARRLGPIGIRLEELLVRDGCSLRVAIEILRAAGYQGKDADLTRLAAKLPFRIRVDEELDKAREAPDPKPPADPLGAQARERVRRALQVALNTLPAEDRLIIRMHFWDQFSVADIARILTLDQKPLYRRIAAITQRVRDLLREQGITDEMARDFLSEDGLW